MNKQILRLKSKVCKGKKFVKGRGEGDKGALQKAACWR